MKWVEEYLMTLNNDGYIPKEPMWFTLSPHLDPELCWELIKKIYYISPDELLGYLGAGPLESLLASNGNVVIERIESFLKENQRFHKVLQAVWRNASSDEIWARIRRLREC
jgi:hypothetical protein